LPKLLIILASTRPGRVGLPVCEWFEGRAREHGGFDVEVADLAAINLPMMDEPHHPRLQNYQHQHTKDWSATVASADAVAFVMPEYNHGIIAPLKNAIDYLNQEWHYKPLGFVSYGGVSAATRAVQMTKQVVTAVKMAPVPEAVSIPFVAQFIDDDGALQPNEVMQDASMAMLDELQKMTAALTPMRS
jgi:NAD(P)H-dependent FMN reductase